MNQFLINVYQAHQTSWMARMGKLRVVSHYERQDDGAAHPVRLVPKWSSLFMGYNIGGDRNNFLNLMVVRDVILFGCYMLP